MTFWMGSKSCTIWSAPAEIGGFVCLGVLVQIGLSER